MPLTPPSPSPSFHIQCVLQITPLNQPKFIAIGIRHWGQPSSSITKVDCPNSPGRLMDVVVAFSAAISNFNVFASGSYSGLKSSITPKSCLCSTSSSIIKTALGGSTAKLFYPILQLLIKSVVFADPTILSGLSENNIVLSVTSLNSKCRSCSIYFKY